MNRLISLVVATVALAACSILMKPASTPLLVGQPCNVSVIGYASRLDFPAGGSAPDGGQVIATATDFDPSTSRVDPDPLAGLEVEFDLRGEAIQRFSDWTDDHVGDSLAFVIDGTVASAALITDRVADGRIRLSASLAGSTELEAPFMSCFR